jgi:predicted ribonuclease YlaK
LLNTNHLFEDETKKVVISSITLQELEEIKTSKYKDEDLKQQARRLLRELEKHADEYEVYVYIPLMGTPFEIKGFQITNDIKILASAVDYDRRMHPDETVFITNDLALKQIANLFFGEDSIYSINEEIIDNYAGYEEIVLGDSALAEFYENPHSNVFDLLQN